MEALESEPNRCAFVASVFASEWMGQTGSRGFPLEDGAQGRPLWQQPRFDSWSLIYLFILLEQI